MQIRQYNSRDLNGVIRTWELASEVGHPFLSEEFLQTERANIPAVYLPNGDTWVALVRGGIVGFVVLHGNEVGALFVKPALHGRGIGYALMNKARDLHPLLKVEVFKQNQIGNKFYARYGFKLVGEYMHVESAMMMLCLEYDNGKQQSAGFVVD